MFQLLSYQHRYYSDNESVSWGDWIISTSFKLYLNTVISGLDLLTSADPQKA